MDSNVNLSQRPEGGLRRMGQKTKAQTRDVTPEDNLITTTVAGKFRDNRDFSKETIRH